MRGNTNRQNPVLRRLMDLSGERRIGPNGLFGEVVSLPRRAGRFMVSTALGLGAVVVVGWLLFRDQDCLYVLFDVEFAGSPQRLQARLTDPERMVAACDLSTVRGLVWRDIGFSALYAVVAGLLLTVWWNASWDTEPGFSRIDGAVFAGLAGATFVVELIENALMLTGLEAGENGVLTVGTPLRFIFTVAWVKWMLIGLLVAASISVFLAWSIRLVAITYRHFRGSHRADLAPAVVRWDPDDKAGLGICLSGGGIRSAGFSLGALSALEEVEIGEPDPDCPPGLLGQADLLASVSGGGYAASAWRTAVGNADDPIIDRAIIGNPNRHASRDPSAVAVTGPGGSSSTDERDLFPYLRDRRDYPRNGRGGMLVSAVIVVVQMLWHITLSLAVLVLLAWPVGQLIGSWIISTPGQNGGDSVIDYGRLAIPSLGLLVVLLGVLVGRSFTHRGPVRNALNLLSLGLIGLSGMLATVLVAVPWMVTWLLGQLPGSTAERSTLATFLCSSLVITVLRMLRAPIQSRLRYLGGVLLAVGLIWFWLFVTSLAADVDNPSYWWWWLVGLGVYAAILLVANPDLWSLHWVYRRTLAQTFARRWNRETNEWDELPAGEQPPLSSYRDAPGPKQVICAVAARGERTNTGVAALSMTFEPDNVTVHCGPDPVDETRSLSYAIPTAAYEDIFRGRAFGDRYTTVFAATALSAAAVAPSLGRMNLGSTNALIAALNLRLGVWMPNPSIGVATGPDRI